MKNLTPKHLRCQPYYACPSVHDFEDGYVLIVGRAATEEELDAAEANVGDNEFAIVVSKELLSEVNS